MSEELEPKNYWECTYDASGNDLMSKLDKLFDNGGSFRENYEYIGKVNGVGREGYKRRFSIYSYLSLEITNSGSFELIHPREMSNPDLNANKMVVVNRMIEEIRDIFKELEEKFNEIIVRESIMCNEI